MDALLDRYSSVGLDARTSRPKLWIRPIRPSDADALQRAFEQQSAESRYYRFHSALRRLPEPLLHHLTHVDGIDHVALVALERVGSRTLTGVGVARFIRDKTIKDHAELAIAVADHAQGHGIARRLLRALAREARTRGIRTFMMTVVAGNARVRHMLAHLGAVGRGSDADIISYDIAVSALDDSAIEAFAAAAH